MILDPVRRGRSTDRMVGLAALLLPVAALAVASPREAAAAGSLPSTTTLSSSSNPSSDGKGMTFTATVTGPGTVSAGGSPAGTVTFAEYPSGPIQNVPLTGGEATVSLASLAPGLHLVTADYGGDGRFAQSGAQLTQRVGPPVASAAFASSDRNPSDAGQPVTLSAGIATAAGFGVAGGSIVFKDGGAVLGTVPVSVLAAPSALGPPQDLASFTVPALGAGLHSITAVYSGDGNLSASASAAWTQVVGRKAGTSTALASDQRRSLNGQTVVVTATVTPSTPTSSEPAGLLTFRDGATVVGSAPVRNRSASLPISLLGAGSHVLTAVYGGDSNFAESTSGTLEQVVLGVGGGPAATTVALAGGPPSAVAGEPVRLTATVTPVSGSAVPAGTVYFIEESGAVVATAALDAAGKASVTLVDLSPAPHRLQAVFAGDAQFAASSSFALDVSIGRASSAVIVSSSRNPSAPDEEVAFTATVTGQAAGAGSPPPSGSVTFSDQGGVLGTVEVGGGGIATLPVSGLAAGRHAVTAVYNGDEGYAGGSATISQTVGDPVPTSTALGDAALRGSEVPAVTEQVPSEERRRRSQPQS